MKKCLSFLDERGEEIVLVTTMILMILIITLQVVMRKVFNNSLSWSEELARYLFVWQIWIGVSYAVRKNQHIRVDVLKDAVSQRGKLVLDLIMIVIFFAFCAYMGSRSVLVVQKIALSRQISPALALPMWIPNLAVPVGILLSGLRLAQAFVLKIQEIRKLAAAPRLREVTE